MSDGRNRNQAETKKFGSFGAETVTETDTRSGSTRKCYYQLRQFRVFSRSLTHQSTLTLVHAFVISRIDSCSSLLVGLPLGTLARLDRVLRSAARLVGRLLKFKFSPITAYMRDVHVLWLPISQRIQYRITALVSRCVLRCAPLTFVISAAQCRF